MAAIQAGRHTDQTVEIAGWLYNLRKSGKIVFPIVRDGTGLIQCVALKSELPERRFRRAEASDAGIVAHRARQGSRRSAGAGRI